MQIRIKIDPKGFQRMVDYTLGTEEFDWVDIDVMGTDITVNQAEILRDLTTVGLTLAMDDRGKLTVVKD